MKPVLKIRAIALALTFLPGLALALIPENSAAASSTNPLPLTPSQAEGPYYPVAKLTDQDSDLTRIGTGRIAEGTVILLNGRVLDQAGRPVPAAIVELWQTDTHGIYMHPGDSRTEQRDQAFQFFGQALTDDLGRFEFRTILPGIYGTRPRHMHAKVIRPGKRTLTTQLYFKGDERLARDFLTRRLGERLSALLLDPQPGANDTLRAAIAFVVE